MADKPLLGCIADDFTGATDLASQLVAAGMRVVQTIGVPSAPLDTECDAVVVALKSRTVAPARAVEASLSALAWLREQGCGRFYFKYCSTFDSTAEGNIGPVTDALMAALGVDFTLAVPALPANRRTVYNGYLFANDRLLNESGMQDHPLTPMTDPCLLRVLAPQTRHRVGLVSHRDLANGVEAVRARFETLRGEGVGIAICDTLAESDLHLLAAAASDVPLLTGGSGLGLSIPATLAGFTPRADADQLAPIAGRALILSGSCSRATLGQLEHARRRYPSIAVELESLAEAFDAQLQSLFDYCLAHLEHGPVVVYASAPAERLRELQARFGVEASGALIERALATLARRLVDEAGVRRILVAGGESSGAVVEALGVEGLKIGPSIDTGVPWTHSVGGEPRLALALKSGNFGQPDLMTRAWEVLP